MSDETETKWDVLLKSPRAQLYLEIEKELQKQEKLNEQPISESMWMDDPRTPVMHTMGALRDVAEATLYPDKYKTAMFRAACVVIASLQVTYDWVSRIAMERAVKRVIITDERN